MSKTISSLSLYLHIPFCTTKCSYCAFNTYTHLENLIESYVDALVQEIQWVGRSNTLSVGTIFFGGGTPSLLSVAQFQTIFDQLHQSFAILPDAEISIEANPADLTRDYLVELRTIGVNRLSIGMQSAVQSELELFDRRHDNDAVVRAYSAARSAGFDNINLDLIFGAPHQTLESWQTSLRGALALQPEHLSLYALVLEENTSMHAWVNRGRLPEPDDDLAADMYDLASAQLAAHGYEQYEISNWSKPGRMCQHNLQYWFNLPYAGLGPGAHGFAGGVRYANLLSPQRYIKKLRETLDGDFPFPLTPVIEDSTVVDYETDMAETLMMGMRLTQTGIDRAVFAQRFGKDLLDIHGEPLLRFAEQGLVQIDDQRVRLTDRGRLLSNIVFRELV